MKAHFIDVGQGASTLLEFPCAAVLIDAGGEKNAAYNGVASLTDYLDNFFATRPDLNSTLASIVLTHPHTDHTLGVPSILTKYHVQNAVTNGMGNGSGRYGQIALHNFVATSEESESPEDGIGYVAAWQQDIPISGLTNNIIDPINCTNVDPKITVLWGRVAEKPDHWTVKNFENGNNHSVVIRVDFGKSSLLISGDLEDAAIEDLASFYKDTHLLDVDVHVANHHGSYNGTTENLLREISPRISVIEMGPSTRAIPWTAWAYGHPRRSAVDILQRFTSGKRDSVAVDVASTVKKFSTINLTKAIYGTGWDGSIVLEADVKGNWKNFGSDAGQTRINLNTATVDELIALPMIGLERASAIIAYRETNGNFDSVDDLLKVKSIKSGTISAVRNLVRVE